MSSDRDLVTQERVERMHQEGLRAAERIDPLIRQMLADMATAKKLPMPEPVLSIIHRDRLGNDRRYATWQIARDRGRFMVKVELFSDENYSHLYAKAILQSRFWESEAQRLGDTLSKAIGVRVEVERTQSDGIISYSGTWQPE